MKVYNTLTGNKEEFKTIEENKVSMYVCGVTVYDYCHVGHARAYLSFDAIHRYLKHKGYDVKYVRNFTDVDDKIIKRSIEEKLTIKELTDKYIKAFHDDMRTLKVLDATIEPRATEHIKEMIEMIQKLIDNNYAYESQGDVYFAVSNFKEYGMLSHRKLDDMISGVRIVNSDKKKSPLDFTLWKKSKENENSWNSPWSEGRPGWHLECSAMSTKYLGANFDIHGGGKDLVFPHHENEIAQSQCSTNKKYANYWLHNGFVNIDGTKMSKSLGNFFTLQNILDIYAPEVLRFFVLSNHYRSPINFKVEKYNDVNNNEKIKFLSLDEAEERLYNIYGTIEEINEIVNSASKKGNNLDKDFTSSILSNFEKAMDDDFNTAAALGEFSKIIRFANDIINKPKTKLKDKKETLTHVKENIEKISRVLGIFEQEPKEYINKIIDKKLKIIGINKEFVEEKIEERNKAKKEKNYELSDSIRNDLLKYGILLQDSPKGTKWKLS